WVSVGTGPRPVGPGQRPGPTPGPTQRFGPATVCGRVYDPSVRVRDPHRTHTEIRAGNSVATGLRPVGPGQRPGPTPNPSVRVRKPDPDPHRDLGRQQCGDGSTTRRSGSETRTHTGPTQRFGPTNSVATGLRPVRPGQRPGPTPDPHRDSGRQQCGDGSTTRPSGSETRTRTHTGIRADNSVATGLRPVGPGQRPGPTPNPSVRVRDPDPHRTDTEIWGRQQCGDGSTTRPVRVRDPDPHLTRRSGSETRTHTGPTQRFGPATVWRRVYDPSVRVRDPDPHRTHTEIRAGNSVATGLRPVGPGQRPGPTPGPTQRSRIIYSGLPPAIEGTSSTSSPSWKA